MLRALAVRTYRLLMEAYRSWSADRAARLGAGLAYYALFALVPILFLAITMAGFVFGEEVVGSSVEERITDLVGPELASNLATAIDNLRQESAASFLPILSLGVLVVSASVLFVAWKEVVDYVWGIPKELGFLANLRRRLFGAVMIASAGVFLSVMIFAETVLGAINQYANSAWADALLAFTGSIAPVVLGALFLVVLLKYTPERHVPWRAVWFPGLLTMALLALAAWLYGRYLATWGLANASGVAGSVFLGLALVYYAAQILLYGVELSKVMERRVVLELERIEP